MGYSACAPGAGSFRPPSDPSPGLYAFEIGGSPDIYAFSMLLEGPKAYATDYDAYQTGGYTLPFEPKSEIASLVAGFERYYMIDTARPYELTVARAAAGEAIWAAFGIRATATQVCVYASSLDRAMPPIGAVDELTGNVDGLVGKTAINGRLYGSRSKLNFNKAAGSGTLTLELKTTDTPFGNYSARPVVPLITLTSALTLIPTGQLKGNLASPDNAWSGRVFGQVGPPVDRAAIFAFVLEHKDGTRIIGATAMGDENPWDY